MNASLVRSTYKEDVCRFGRAQLPGVEVDIPGDGDDTDLTLAMTASLLRILAESRRLRNLILANVERICVCCEFDPSAIKVIALTNGKYEIRIFKNRSQQVPDMETLLNDGAGIANLEVGNVARRHLLAVVGDIFSDVMNLSNVDQKRDLMDAIAAWSFPSGDWSVTDLDLQKTFVDWVAPIASTKSPTCNRSRDVRTWANLIVSLSAGAE